MELKVRNKEISMEWAEMMIKFSEEIRNIGYKRIAQVVINEDTVLLKGRNGRYITTLSLKELNENVKNVLEG